MIYVLATYYQTLSLLLTPPLIFRPIRKTFDQVSEKCAVSTFKPPLFLRKIVERGFKSSDRI